MPRNPSVSDGFGAGPPGGKAGRAAEPIAVPVANEPGRNGREGKRDEGSSRDDKHAYKHDNGDKYERDKHDRSSHDRDRHDRDWREREDDDGCNRAGRDKHGRDRDDDDDRHGKDRDGRDHHGRGRDDDDRDDDDRHGRDRHGRDDGDHDRRGHEHDHGDHHDRDEGGHADPGCGCEEVRPGKVPEVLDVFGSVVKLFGKEASRGTVDESFREIVERLDSAAQKLHDKAEKRGLQDIDDTPLAVTFGGDASAYGEDTFASAFMLGLAVDVGLVSFAVGTATYTAAAEAAEGDTAIALADSFAIASGADLVITFTTRGESELTHGAEDAFATSTVSFIAIDLEFWDPCNGPIMIDGSAEDFDLDALLALDGNTADLVASLEALDEDTYVGLESDVLTIEDTLSGATAIGTLALG